MISITLFCPWRIIDSQQLNGLKIKPTQFFLLVQRITTIVVKPIGEGAYRRNKTGTLLKHKYYIGESDNPNEV